MRLKLAASLLPFIVLFLFVACTGEEESSTKGGDPDMGADGDAEDEGIEYPDPSFVFEARNQSVKVADETYFEEKPDQFITAESLADLDVRAVSYIGIMLYAGTATGRLFARSDGDAIFYELQQVDQVRLRDETDGDEEHEGESYVAQPNPAVVDIARSLYGGRIAVAFDDRVELAVPSGDPAEVLDFEGHISSVSATDSMLVVGTDNGIYQWSGTEWSQVEGSTGMEIRDCAIHSTGAILAATSGGTIAVGDIDADLVYPVPPEGDFVALAVCGSNAAWAKADSLFIAEDDASGVAVPAGKGGLPTGDLLTVDCNADGILIGHEIGATYLSADLGHVDHYISRRWLPDNRVPAVALGRDGERWFGTNAGVSRIYLVERTLKEKEAVFDDYIEYFWRMGGFFSSDGRTPTPYSELSEMSLGDKDNDGLWTQMMVGAWCMAYDMTGKEKYYEYARKAMDNMFLLIDMPAVTFEELGMERGFISRSIVSEEEGDLYTSKVERGELVHIGGDEYKDILRWNPVAWEGDNYLWKADTSSDETTGHFFGFPVFYDLCAKDEAEKAEVAGYAADLARYIIDGGFVLIDLDGTRTMHGHWNPETLAIAMGGWDGVQKCMQAGHDSEECLSAAFGGGWLNSLEILGHLLAAYHMTGDTEFYDAYEMLIKDHRYDELAMANEETYTITKVSTANHSDHELAMLAYTTLIRYEARDDRRQQWLDSLAFLYDWELPERNPWWAAVYAISGGSAPDAESSRRTLREIPDDLREWSVDNSHRKDAERLENDRHGEPQFDTVFPYDELRTFWWNGNPFSAIEGGDGRSWSAPTVWLLPYYMNLYSGLLVPAESR